MVQLLSFNEAIDESNAFSKKHLILGNGFSIACRPDIFHYGSLFARADFSNYPNLPGVFATLDTQDFEVAIRSLENGARLAPIYVSDAGVAPSMKSDAASLKEILLTTIAGNHPHIPAEIADDKFWACRRFLSHFLGGQAGGQVFTLNYDLLLYWTLMHGDHPDEPLAIETNDGFGNDEADPDADYVVWHGETAPHSARVHFLHGALHLFDAGRDLQKYTWVRKGVRLIDQAREAMGNGKFPVFVAEGTSAQKKEKIRHNAYLYQGLKQLTSNALTRAHCFFIHGHSLAENDDHILVRLARGKFKKLYVSLHGDPASQTNKGIINKAHQMASQRSENVPLEVAFYGSESASVWG
jgi:hypothetical protein